MNATVARSATACPVPDLHWTSVTNALIQADLSPRQFQVAVTLLSYKWYASSPIVPSVKTLAGRLRCSVRTIQYALRGLVRKGYFLVHYTFRPDGGQMSNVYEIGPMLAPLLAPVPAASCTSPQQPLHPPVQPAAHKGPERNQMNGITRTQGRYGAPQATKDYLSGPFGAYIHT